jgi:hypothetical protein
VGEGVKLLRMETVDLRNVVLPDLTGQPLTRSQVDPIARPVFRELRCGGRKVALQLVSGRRIVAAHLKERAYRIEADIVDCTDSEAQRHEMLDHAVWLFHYGKTAEKYEHIRKLVKSFEDVAKVELAERPLDLNKKRGRRPSPRARAVQLTVSALGHLLSEKTVMRAVWAGEHGKRIKMADFETYGLLEDKHPFLLEVAAARKHIDRAIRGITIARAALTTMGDDPDARGLLGPVRDRVAKSLEAISAELIAVRPRGLCPYCKGVPWLQEQCSECLGQGWVGKLRSAPDDELVEGEPRVFWKRQLVAVRDLLERLRKGTA